MQDKFNSDAKNSSAQNNHSQSKRKITFFILFTVVFLIIVTAIVIVIIKKSSQTTIDPIYYDANKSTYIFSSSDISSIKGMDHFTNPEIIDLRGSSISCDDSVKLIEMYPDCKIRWYVPLASPTDSFSSEVKLASADSDKIHLLSYFPNLTYIDARGLDLKTIENISSQRNDCEIDWEITIGSDRYPSDVEFISFTDATAEEILSLSYLKNLKKVDAVGCTEYEALLEASQKMPDCEFIWSANISGIEILSTDTEINFNRREVADIAALDREFELLKYFPNIKTVDMCGCGVPSEQMAKWRDKYSNVKFIWEVTFGTKYKNWTVRTDIKVFSSLLGSGASFGSQEMYKELLLYCTDLVALDLGHNKISDLSLFTNLKNLQGLILTDNPVSDFSPLAELPNIQFLEINMTKISDLTPLQKCSKLVHLDVHYTKVRDISPLYECDNLKAVILASTNIPLSQRKEIKKRLPNCKVAYTVINENYKTLNSPIRNSFRLAFKNWDQVEDFVDWQNVTYKKDAKLIYPRGYVDYSE